MVKYTNAQLDALFAALADSTRRGVLAGGSPRRACPLSGTGERTIATVKETPSLTLVRKFNAAPEKVWRALTHPEALKQWMGPSDEFAVPIADADVRVGGRYRIVMKSPDGEEHDVRGVYREVVPNRRLVYTWAWTGTPEHESLVTLELAAVGSGTGLTLKHEQFFDAEARDKHQQGWTGCIARLERFLA